MSSQLPECAPIADHQVLLHIGVHKTGTTAIQAALADARSELEDHNVRYPGKLQAQHRAALAVLGRPWGWNNRGGAVLDREHFTRLVARTKEAPGRVVISSEFFCEAPEETAQQVVSELGDVRVVVTLRNLGKLLPSSWQQYLKYGLTTQYPEWLEDVFATPGRSSMSPTFWKRHDHGAVIERWAAAAGPDKVTVLVLEDVDRTAMFVSFAELLGIPSEVLTSRMNLTSNRSMTAAEAELLVRLNERVKKQMEWTDYVRLIRRGVALGMVENRKPSADEAPLTTPEWALDAAAVEGQKSVARIQASGVHVVGNLNALAIRAQNPKGAQGSPELVPIDAAVEALASVVVAAHEELTPRQTAGQLVRQVRAQGIRSVFRKNHE